MNPRAVTYRKLNDIPHDLGTAVNVQAMVFGNMGDTSATGVGFTRNPSTGAKEFYGEFLQNAQGEDVVAGIRTPHPIADLEKVMPEAYKQLREITTRLERHYKDVQDFEFTIQENKLYMLQTRNGKRTGLAAVHIAVDMVEEGILTPQEAVMKVEPQALDQLLHPIFDPKERAKAEVAAKGLPASPGAATGAVVFTADDAVAWAQKGKRVLLVRMETVPDDIHGMSVAQGILTATGGMTSHAAVVGRQMGKPSVVGCGALADRRQGARSSRSAGKVVSGGRPHLHRRHHRRGDPEGAAHEPLRGAAGRRGQAQARDSRRSTRSSRSCCAGPTRSAGWASAPTPTSRATPRWPSRSARAASASAAPSTCSSPRTGCRTS